MLRFRSLVLAVLGTVALVGTGRADFIRSFAYTDRGVYTGTFTRYTTLNDAQAGTNAVGVPGTLAPTDLSVFFARDIVSGIGANYDPLVQGAGGQTAQFLNQWFYSTTSPPGTGNPNNTSDRFVQIDDIDGSTPVSHSGYWTSPTLNQFRLQVAGQNAFATPGDPNGDPDIARLSAPGILPPSNPNGLGNWISYNLDLTFDGLAGVLDPSLGANFYRSNGDPTAISGSFAGLFQMNDDPTGFYRVDLTVSQGNTFGFVNAANLDPSNPPYLTSTFGSAQIGVTAVPAPPSVLLAGFGVVMGLMIRRQRAKV